MFGMNAYLLRCQVDANRTVQSGYDVDVFRTSQMKQVFSPVFTPVFTQCSYVCRRGGWRRRQLAEEHRRFP
ncbi:hypothetical protein SCLCIDRAFT_969837 [Scleroderma citrinum Foug A]|uniref:Uncharacterized protein n=1 Tax=Scleroderma citrinum Foug A TaxID=1036808 RepID=A0A0C2ZEF8_9AGAM|nr:hypothetical protein SCLCIDRAFT_969837 [Scleroderma citrinum Foug A]